MLTNSSSELRSPRASVLMRAVTWLMTLRKPVFPHDPGEYEAQLSRRTLPPDAPMPPKFERKFRVERWQAAGHDVVTLHPRSPHPAKIDPATNDPQVGRGNWHMLYFHGGGFVLPMFKVHWPLVAAMVETCGMSVSVPLYPVVPESTAADQDGVADAAFAALAERHDPARIILNGDSAGGHMALALALRLIRAGGPQPGKLALFAPWLDLTLADPEIAAVEPHDIMLKIATLRVCGAMFAGERDARSATCSPLYTDAAELAALPPTRIWTGRHDLFIVDSRSFVRKLRGAGVDARLYEYEGAPHVFMAITPTREAKDVLATLRDFIEG